MCCDVYGCVVLCCITLFRVVVSCMTLWFVVVLCVVACHVMCYGDMVELLCSVLRCVVMRGVVYCVWFACCCIALCWCVV